MLPAEGADSEVTRGTNSVGAEVSERLSPSAVVVVAGSCQIEATETLCWLDGVAVGHRAQR